MWKAVAAHLGYSTLPSALDWVLGVIWVLISYWVGLLESDCPTVAPWFMQEDLYGKPILRNCVMIITGVTALSTFFTSILFASARLGDSSITKDPVLIAVTALASIIPGIILLLIGMNYAPDLGLVIYNYP